MVSKQLLMLRIDGKMIKQLAILAGGKGLRLGLTDIPKPMVDIAGKPLLLRQIELAKRYGVEEIFLLEGHLADVIQNYFGDGSKFGVQIHHIVEQEPLGTAGAVKLLKDRIHQSFLVFYGDIVMDFDVAHFVNYAEKDSCAIATVITHPCNHPYDSDLLEVDDSGNVTRFLSKPHPEGLIYRNLGNACVYVLSPKVFQYIETGSAQDFGHDIFPKMLANGTRIRAYQTPEYICDIGTKDRFAHASRDVKSGKATRFNRENPRPAIFLDRDGTINRDMGDAKNINNFELLPNVAEAIKMINKTGYLAVVITNQGILAKGLSSFEGYRQMQKKMETLLGNEGAFVDASYFCPHMPAKYRDFPGEVTELKTDCACRKPAPGMILQAAKDMNIDIASSWMIGDQDCDVEAGRVAGCHTIKLKKNDGGLFDAVKNILRSQG
jgi:D,D-heptose 1,7-bisphosphate phosphatase